jgi:hypothetical protein
MPWSAIEAEYGDALNKTGFFDVTTEGGKKRFDDFRGMVVEHNIRTISQYYTRISGVHHIACFFAF